MPRSASCASRNGGKASTGGLLGLERRQAKAANAAYDAGGTRSTARRISKAAQAAITAFAAHFNQMKGIETSERDDIGEAVWQFSQRDSACGSA